jgi:hypothetical protein
MEENLGFISVIKSRQFGRAVHVARMGNMTCHTKFYLGKLKEETHWET